MALSLALHGAALLPLLLAGLAGGAATDAALYVELTLAAPAPSVVDRDDGPAGEETPPASPPTETSSAESIDLPPPDQPPPLDTAQLLPSLPPPQAAPEPEIKIELPPPDEPPPLNTADLKPVDPPKQEAVQKTPPPEIPPTPVKPPDRAPVRAAAKPAARPGGRAAPVTQTSAAPDSGDAQATQAMAAAQEPAIVFEGKPRFRVPPRPAAYPPRAVELGQQGETLIRVRLDPDGSAAEIVLWRGSGFELLDRAAITAVRGWQFLPAIRGGRAVAAWVEIPVRFHLR
ncbi:MAG: energy transducer TonB [Enhydrobacter sp.]|nr:MAG: energy transducer TonB [Enhydrobacter sp.]